MNARTIHKWLATTALALLASACETGQHSGPPAVRYGHDACAHCGMIISDERFASAIVEPEPDQEPLLFDDVGCMIGYERKNPAPDRPHYFHDATTHQWITAGQACFIKTTQHTPMGSGIVGFATRAQAEALARDKARHDSAVTTYDQLLREPAESAEPH